MTDKEKEVVKELNHPLYTVEFLEEWIERRDAVFTDQPSALQTMAVIGYYDAVSRIAEKSAVFINSQKIENNSSLIFGTLGEGKGYPAKESPEEARKLKG